MNKRGAKRPQLCSVVYWVTILALVLLIATLVWTNLVFRVLIGATHGDVS